VPQRGLQKAFDVTKAARCIRWCRVRQSIHRAEISGIEHIPETGRAIMVSNHGRLDFDFFILVKLMWDHCHRLPRCLADRIWFKLPLIRSLFHRAGAVEGNRVNAIALLRQDHIVLTYPGGVREIMTSRFGKEHIRWEGRTGFAKIAIAAQSPVIPVASKGVNNGFIFVTSGKWLGRLLFRGILRMGPSYDDYRDPLAIGLIPFPLPFSMAVHFPWPCKVRYIVGKPIAPECGPEAADDPELIRQFADRVGDALRNLLRVS
jgi:1-acyl-sn-glycerol-3-phosphate acyltransferase